MKILVIGRSYPTVETAMFGSFEYDQALILHNTGHDVRYFFQDTRPIYRLHKIGFYSYKDEIISSGVYIPVGHLPRPIYNSIKLKTIKKYLAPLLAEFQPDIVHIHYPSILLTDELWAYLRSKCKKIVMTEHYTKVMTQQLPKWKLQELSKTYSQSDCVLCVSEALRASVKKMCDNPNVYLMPNAVSSEICAKKGKDENKFAFVYVGRLAEVKQVNILLDAFKIVCEKDSECQLYIVGDGPKMASLKRQATRKNISARVRFFGNVTREKVGQIVSMSNFFVTATRLETFCVPVIEAWYCGLPVIVPDSIPILAYMNTENAIVFHDSNVRELAFAMCKAIKTEEKFDSEQIADNARKKFGEENIGAMLTNVYENIL